MNTSQILSLLSVLFCAVGTFFLGKGFWPPTAKFVISKAKILKGGKVIKEIPAVLEEEGIPDSEVPEEIKKLFQGTDLVLYKIYAKKSKELVKLKLNGCIGTAFILIGCIFAGLAIFI